MMHPQNSSKRNSGDAQPRVVIVYHNPLFAQGIASLLRGKGIPDVVGLPGSEPATAHRVRALAPAIVILEGLQEKMRPLVPLLDDIPWVIRVGLDGTPAEIYRHENLLPDSALVRLVARLARRAERQRVETQP